MGDGVSGHTNGDVVGNFATEAVGAHDLVLLCAQFVAHPRSCFPPFVGKLLCFGMLEDSGLLDSAPLARNIGFGAQSGVKVSERSLPSGSRGEASRITGACEKRVSGRKLPQHGATLDRGETGEVAVDALVGATVRKLSGVAGARRGHCDSPHAPLVPAPRLEAVGCAIADPERGCPVA